MARWLDDDEQRTWRMFLAVQRRLPEALERQLHREAGLPYPYYIVLAMLSEAPGRALRMSDLAEMTNSSPSRLSHAVARLEDRSWVRRERATEDGRGNRAVLTDAGMDVVVAAAPGHVAAVRRYLFDVITPEQRRVLEEICAQMLDSLSRAPRPVETLCPLDAG